MPNLYSNCAILTTNCYLYTNSNGSTPVGAGFYSDGSTCWGTNTSGMITGSTTCPTPTPSASPTPTPTATVSNLSIDIYIKNQFSASATTQSNYGLYYNVNSGSDTLISNLGSVTTTCQYLYNIQIPSGSTLYIGAKNISGGLGISFNANNTTSCPSATGVYCGTLDSGDALYYNYGTVSATGTIAITLSIFNGGYLACA